MSTHVAAARTAVEAAARALEPLPEDLPPARLTENARIVLARRYLAKDEQGRPIEEPEAMFWRVARVLAAEDARYGASPGAVEFELAPGSHTSKNAAKVISIFSPLQASTTPSRTSSIRMTCPSATAG